MTVAIYPSKKFHHSDQQYCAEAGGYILLRLTLGQKNGKLGGAIKTATAGESGGAPAYKNRERLIDALRHSVLKLGGSADAVALCYDEQSSRKFGECTGEGSIDDLQTALTDLTEEMAMKLGLLPSSRDEMQALYSDLCIGDGIPVYLSDGGYLDADGNLFE